MLPGGGGRGELRKREEKGNPSPSSPPAVSLIENLSKGGAPSLRNVLSFKIEFERVAVTKKTKKLEEEV